jgi:hypothetical protein
LTVKAKGSAYEQLACRVEKSDGSLLTVINCYSPSTDLFRDCIDRLSASLETLVEAQRQFIIVGDLNIDGFSESAAATALDELFAQFDLSNKIQHVTRRASGTQLDYVICRSEHEHQLRCAVSDACVDSDHCAIEISASISPVKAKPQMKQFRDYKHFDEHAFRVSLQEADWSACDAGLAAADPSAAGAAFVETFSAIHDQHAPLKAFLCRPNHIPYMTHELLTEINLRKRLRRKAERSRMKEDFDVFKKHRNRVKNKLRFARREHYLGKFASAGSPRDIHRLVRLLSQPGRACGKQRTLDEVAGFNEFFSSVGVRVQEETDGTPDYTTVTEAPPGAFSLRFITAADVARAVSSLPSWSAPGLDGVKGYVLKAALPVISGRIERLFNLSVQTATFPAVFKKAVVVPVPKVSGADGPDEHRPISLLALISKAFERIIYDQVYGYFGPMLSECQTGFRKGMSTEAALIRISDEIMSNMDNRRVSLLVLLDLCKAFDSVDHEYELGFDEATVAWFRSYLSGRTQVTRCGSVTSAEANVEAGVPQGSILGPLLFLILVNDLPNCIKHTLTRQFADDTQLLHSYDPKDAESIAAARDQLNEDLESVRKWCKANSLKLNAAKCIVLAIAHPVVRAGAALPKLVIGDSEIAYVDCSRNLGVTFDSNHCFKQHIDNIAQTATGRLANLGRVRDLMPPDVLRRTVESLVLPAALYGLSVWSVCSNTQLQRVQRLQNWGARVISGLRKYDHVSGVREQLGWLNVTEMKKVSLATASYSAMNGEMGPELQSKFAHAQHGYQTRQQTAGMFYRPDVPGKRGGQRFSFAGPEVLNEFIDVVNAGLPKKAFKAAVKNRIVECRNA